MSTRSSLRPEQRVEHAKELMLQFAERTRIEAGGPNARRYLWTDAYAVCNFLSLARATHESRWERLALQLTERVHATLGRHRADDARTGWLSGLPEHEGRAHPTRGGLRIGKALQERKASEPTDPHMEWDRDGQYFHYLTRWTHALTRLSVETSKIEPLAQAVELVEAAHRGFTRCDTDGTLRMHWKMSIDLQRPLVSSMGQHDALDGWTTAIEAATVVRKHDEPIELGGLAEAVRDWRSISARVDPSTTDPLGIGSLLVCAGTMAQWLARGEGPMEPRELEIVVQSAARSLDLLAQSGALMQSATHRLPFRELGLSIGLHALPHILRALHRRDIPAKSRIAIDDALFTLHHHESIAADIEHIWLEPTNRTQACWFQHLDINSVMLATSLLPDVFLEA
jgi:hypothetical protein